MSRHRKPQPVSAADKAIWAYEFVLSLVLIAIALWAFTLIAS